MEAFELIVLSTLASLVGFLSFATSTGIAAAVNERREKRDDGWTPDLVAMAFLAVAFFLLGFAMWGRVYWAVYHSLGKFL